MQLYHHIGQHPFLRSVALRPEMVTRVGCSIDYFLVRLGEPALAHKQDPKPCGPGLMHFCELRASWIPRLFGIFVQFGQAPELISAVSEDGRSYKPELFRSLLTAFPPQAEVPLSFKL
jgi:hypothetical protein